MVVRTSAADTMPADAVAAQTAQFHIPAGASLQERSPRTLKHGDTFAMFDHKGDVLAGPGSPEGLYHCDTRYLSHLHLSLSGAPPILLSSTIRDDNAALTCDLTNPDLFMSGRLVLEHDLIHVRRSKFLWKAACHERISVRNFADRPQSIALALDFAADFVDLFEVRGAQRDRRGAVCSPKIEADRVTLAYVGLDGRRRETRLSFQPKPADLAADHATFHLNLEPGARAVVYVVVHCDGGPPDRPPRESFFASFRDARRALRASSSRAASIETSNDIFNEAVRRAVSDLYMLLTDQPQGPYPYAGIPWFSTVFGRDAIITALQTLWIDPTIARGVLGYLAANQADAVDHVADAEPGKILHEVRQGEMAVLGEVPFRRYYGSVDSTPLFVMLAGAYLDRTCDLAFLREIWPNILRALEWMASYGDRDGDGFVEYGTRTADGLVNQGWKDSQDSVFHADGSLARGPIALVEVQGYVYAAKRAAAAIARRLEPGLPAAALDREADDLRMRFDAAFWDGDLGTYVLALDGDKRPCRVRTSNVGHALYTGIALPSRAASVMRNLMDATSFSGWGIRTLASSEPRYNPISYHNGSVWPHDNALVATGLARYGFRQQAACIFQGLFDASVHIELRRLPELFCGFARRRSHGPTFYPVACSPQAWAATVPLSLLETSLGLGFNPDERSVTFHHPVLPKFLSEVVLRGVSVGDASVDIALRRVGEEVAVHVLSRRGDVRVMATS